LLHGRLDTKTSVSKPPSKPPESSKTDVTRLSKIRFINLAMRKKETRMKANAKFAKKETH